MMSGWAASDRSEREKEQKKRADMSARVSFKRQMLTVCCLSISCFCRLSSLSPPCCSLSWHPGCLLSRECSSVAGVVSGMAWSLAWPVRKGLASLQESSPKFRAACLYLEHRFLWRFDGVFKRRPHGLFRYKCVLKGDDSCAVGQFSEDWARK